MNETSHTIEYRQLDADEIDLVGGGRGGRTSDGVWVTCGSIVVVNGTIYVGGINGPIAIGKAPH